MSKFARKDGESAEEWKARLEGQYPFMMTDEDYSAWSNHKHFAAAAADAESREAARLRERRAAVDRAAAGSEVLRGCKATILGMTPADRAAIHDWIRNEIKD